MVLARRAHDQTFYHHVMNPDGKRWSLLEELNDKPSDQAIQRLHVSKPYRNERKLLQFAKLLHEKQLRTHLATQNLEFFRKNLWRCPANSACKHFADLTLTSEIWFHLWNFRYVDLEGLGFWLEFSDVVVLDANLLPRNAEGLNWWISWSQKSWDTTFVGQKLVC